MSKFVRSDSYEQPGNSIPVMGLKIFGYSVLAGIMALFVSFSMLMLTNAAFTTTVGYREYEVINGEQVLIDTVYFDEDTTYESEKVTAEDDRAVSREMIIEPKNPVCAVLIDVMGVIEQLLMILILVVLTGYYVHREGDRDRNLVRHHNMEPQPLKGLWIGLIAAVPSAVLYVLLIVGKCGVLSESVQGVYRLLNASFTPLINAIMPTETYPATAITLWQFVLLFLVWAVLPATCAVCYLLGYHRTFKKIKKKFSK